MANAFVEVMHPRSNEMHGVSAILIMHESHPESLELRVVATYTVQGFCFPICAPKSLFVATNSQITDYQLVTNTLRNL